MFYEVGKVYRKRKRRKRRTREGKEEKMKKEGIRLKQKSKNILGKIMGRIKNKEGKIWDWLAK